MNKALVALTNLINRATEVNYDIGGEYWHIKTETSHTTVGMGKVTTDSIQVCTSGRTGIWIKIEPQQWAEIETLIMARWLDLIQ